MSAIFSTDKKAITAITANDGAATRKISAVWGNVNSQKTKLWELNKEPTMGTLPIGAKVKLGTLYGNKIVQRVANKMNSLVTLITDDIILHGAFDAKEKEEPFSQTGNPSYLLSNVHQWLNSTAAGGKWYTAQHNADMPPLKGYVYPSDSNGYYAQAGYLSEWHIDELQKLQQVSAISIDYFTGKTITISAKVYLPSASEMGLEARYQEGTRLSLFTDDASRIIKDAVVPGIIHSYWLRTCTYSASSWSITSNGGANANEASACNDWLGVRPLCNIPASTLVSQQSDADGCYTLI